MDYINDSEKTKCHLCEKLLKKWFIAVSCTVLLFTLTGCVSLFRSIFSTINIDKLDANNYKYYTYNGKSVKAIYAGTRLNCLYIEDRINREKEEAERLNNQLIWETPSEVYSMSARKGKISGSVGSMGRSKNQIDTSNMPDYFRYVVHSTQFKLIYDQSYSMWYPESENQNYKANADTLVNLFYQEYRGHPYSSKYDFIGKVVIYEIASTENGNLYWWDNGRLYYYQDIYVLELNDKAK